MSYTGAVTSGGPPAVRDLEELTITKLSVGGSSDNNAYLLVRATGAQLLIDAANDSERLIELVGGSLDAIVTTHQHGDHWRRGRPRFLDRSPHVCRSA